MTVSYQYDVASSASGGFIRLLFRWRGSVWKVVYRDMLIFLVSYVLLTMLYRFALTENQQRIFEKIVYFCSTFMDLIPLSFMLGFYVSFIAARWWSQFIAIPWPDKLMNIVAMYIPGLDEASRVVRRTLMRYLNLSLVLVLRSISMAVKRRFPTKDHLVEAGFMTKTELEMFQSVPSTEFNTFWIPCTWFINVLREARQECRITDSNGLKLIMEELNEFRSKCGLLWGYDWISIPLVYTQVVTMATYAFYVACMFGRQQVKTEANEELRGHRYDYFVPIFTILQLMFYMGLLKVAEQLINPFGDDDEDFELNWIIDRHMKVSYLGVDTLNGTPPPLVKDTYYNELDVKIPYTEASRTYKKKTYRGSVAYMQVPMEQQGMVIPDTQEMSDDDGENMSESMGPRRGSIYTLFHGRGGKGSSPSGSFGNLDNVSIESEWKGSLFNLNYDVKNSSGTLGQSQEFVVDMSKEENDEIALQEVVVDPKIKRHRPTIYRSDSLQVPGVSVTSPQEKSTSLICVRKDPSPKIAPKFPREKLKSMFRKRKLSSALPFYKIKGVRFSKDTKDQDNNSSNGESISLMTALPDDDEVDVDITISNPELTEIEKQMGVHPYLAQQAVLPEDLSRGLTKLSVKSAGKKLGGSHNVLGPRERDDIVLPEVHKCTSLPNIQEASFTVAQIAVVPTLGRMVMPKKSKGRRPPKKKKKSPPPPTPPASTDQDTLSEKEQVSDTSEECRRNTLPQIMVTKSGHLTPEHLDLATSSGLSSTSDHSAESVTVPPRVPKRVSVPKSSTAKTPVKDTSGETATGVPPSSRQKQKFSQTQTPPQKTHSAQLSKQAQQTKSFSGPQRTHSLPTAAEKPKIQVRSSSPTRPKETDQPTPEKPKRVLASKFLPSVSSSSPPPGGSGSFATSPVRVIPPLGRTPSFPKTASKPPPVPRQTTAQPLERKPGGNRMQTERKPGVITEEYLSTLPAETSCSIPRGDSVSSSSSSSDKNNQTVKPVVKLTRKDSKSKK